MSTTVSNSRTVPKLASGDRLTRDEFERRYTAEPALKGNAVKDFQSMYFPCIRSGSRETSDNVVILVQICV